MIGEFMNQRFRNQLALSIMAITTLNMHAMDNANDAYDRYKIDGKELTPEYATQLANKADWRTYRQVKKYNSQNNGLVTELLANPDKILVPNSSNPSQLTNWVQGNQAKKHKAGAQDISPDFEHMLKLDDGTILNITGDFTRWIQIICAYLYETELNENRLGQIADTLKSLPVVPTYNTLSYAVYKKMFDKCPKSSFAFPEGSLLVMDAAKPASDNNAIWVSEKIDGEILSPVSQATNLTDQQIKELFDIIAATGAWPMLGNLVKKDDKIYITRSRQQDRTKSRSEKRGEAGLLFSDKMRNDYHTAACSIEDLAVLFGITKDSPQGHTGHPDQARALIKTVFTS